MVHRQESGAQNFGYSGLHIAYDSIEHHSRQFQITFHLRSMPPQNALPARPWPLCGEASPFALLLFCSEPGPVFQEFTHTMQVR